MVKPILVNKNMFKVSKITLESKVNLKEARQTERQSIRVSIYNMYVSNNKNDEVSVSKKRLTLIFLT